MRDDDTCQAVFPRACHVLPQFKPIHGSQGPQKQSRFPITHLPAPAPALPRTPPHLMGQTFPPLCLVYSVPSAWESPVFRLSGQILPPTLGLRAPSSMSRTNSHLSSGGPRGAQAAQTPSGQIFHFDSHWREGLVSWFWSPF